MVWAFVTLAALGLGLLLFGIARLRRIAHAKRMRAAYPDYDVREERGFLSDEECDHLIAAARPFVARSGVGSLEGRGKHSQVRTSSTAFLETGNDSIIVRIKRKIAELTGIPRENQEKIQVTYYRQMQYYAPHFDAFDDAIDATNAAGDRACTVIIYLNDDYEGGATFFPELGRRIAPERGKAVVFQNLEPDGSGPHPLSRHVGEPVISGEKWLSNQWIRERSFRPPGSSRARRRRAAAKGRKKR